jgi:hypothetical protein
MSLQKITEFYTEWFSVCPNIISKYRTIVIFRSFVTQNNDSNKICMSMIVYYHIPNLVCLSATVQEMSPETEY